MALTNRTIYLGTLNHQQKGTPHNGHTRYSINHNWDNLRNHPSIFNHQKEMNYDDRTLPFKESPERIHWITSQISGNFHVWTRIQI